ncbi:hypothetical protein [Streptomyces catenulae]|uniref:Outer membrane channel protein CpnT-like N-terminal domain-containing protein n=1 Tax=Streptomyces catenulae TaxID=66875 RepID=A0ABV2YYT7_9ACTN|nr:hypothetical protein [Streptomyces catenulae]
MIDAHHVPPELQNLLLVVVGNKWPTGDETALRAEAADWRQVAEVLRVCAQDVTAARRAVDAGLAGAARAGIDAFLATLVGRPGAEDDAVLPKAVRCCEGAAEALDALANEIETLRIEILGALIVLAIQLMVDAAAYLFGGAEAAAVEIAAARVLCLAFLRRAAVRVLTRVAESVLAQEGFALLAQVVEVAQGHRGTLDGRQLTAAAVNGAIGGAVGFGAGLAGGALGHGLGKGLAAAGAGSAVRGAADVAWQGGFGAVAGMAEGAAQDAASGLSGDWVSGAANGAFNGAWGARHTAMNPKNLGSLSPADHLEGAVDGLLRAPRSAGAAEAGGAASADGTAEVTYGPSFAPTPEPSPVRSPAPTPVRSPAPTPVPTSSSGTSSPSRSSSDSGSDTDSGIGSDPVSDVGSDSGSDSGSGVTPPPGASPSTPPSTSGPWLGTQPEPYADEFTGPGQLQGGPTGREGHEVWQDGAGWRADGPGAPRGEGAGPFASFGPEPNPWAGLSSGGQGGGSASGASG